MQARTTRFLKITAVAGLLAALLGAVVWWWQSWHAPQLNLRQPGVLRVGYAVEAPYAFVLPNGHVAGESPLCASEVAEALGLQVRWVQTTFDQLIPELEQGRFDLIAAGMFVTPERAARVRFSRPTLRARAGWLTRRGNPKRLGSYAALPSRADLRLGVLAGSVEERLLQALALSPGTLLPLPDAQTGIAAVSSGQIDALALSLPTVAYAARLQPARLAAVPATDGGTAATHWVALAFRKQDERLAQAADRVLGRTLQSDAHLQALEQWGLGADDLPGPDAPAPGAPR